MTAKTIILCNYHAAWTTYCWQTGFTDRIYTSPCSKKGEGAGVTSIISVTTPCRTPHIAFRPPHIELQTFHIEFWRPRLEFRTLQIELQVFQIEFRTPQPQIEFWTPQIELQEISKSEHLELVLGTEALFNSIHSIQSIHQFNSICRHRLARTVMGGGARLHCLSAFIDGGRVGSIGLIWI